MFFSREVAYRLGRELMGFTLYVVGRPPSNSGLFAIGSTGGSEKGLGFQVRMFNHDVGISVWKQVRTPRIGGTLLFIDLDSKSDETVVGSSNKIVN